LFISFYVYGLIFLRSLPSEPRLSFSFRDQFSPAYPKKTSFTYIVTYPTVHCRFSLFSGDSFVWYISAVFSFLFHRGILFSLAPLSFLCFSAIARLAVFFFTWFALPTHSLSPRPGRVPILLAIRFSNSSSSKHFMSTLPRWSITLHNPGTEAVLFYACFLCVCVWWWLCFFCVVVVFLCFFGILCCWLCVLYLSVVCVLFSPPFLCPAF